MSSEPVTLQELLDSRERRVQKQKSLLSQYEGVLISVTLNIPGPVKDKPAYRKALQAAMELLAERFAGDPIIYKEVRYLKTGA